MAQLYSCGPAFFYAGVGPLDSPDRTFAAVFLGVALTPPEIHLLPYQRPLKSDDSGDGADDVQFAGEEAYIIADLNWYNEKVYARLQSRPNYAGVRGAIGQRDTGRLLRRGHCTYPLWLQFPYAAKLAMGGAAAANGVVPAASITPAAILAAVAGIGGAALGITTTQFGNVGTGQQLTAMPAGYHFLSCYITQDRMGRLGTAARKNSLIWHGIRLPGVRSNSGKTVSVLYDHDMHGLIGAGAPR